MKCADADPLLHAYLDGELDLSSSLRIERHLSVCEACSALYQTLQRLREEIVSADLDFAAEANLERLRVSVHRTVHGSTGWAHYWRTPWISVAVAAIVLFAVMVPGRLWITGDRTHREVVDNHVRSLMTDHLIDVVSSDRHTVKPWFQGRLNFSPPVPDLMADGFTLAGGRLDVIGGQPAAAIVYKRHNHVINLWIAPAENAGQKSDERQFDGYHLLRWHGGPFTYWVVSDLNLAELRTFADLIRSN
jgi:anti-sigma factor RsiW